MDGRTDKVWWRRGRGGRERERFHAVHFEQFACHQAQKRLHQPQRVKGKILYRRKRATWKKPLSLTLLCAHISPTRLDSVLWPTRMGGGEEEEEQHNIFQFFYISFSSFCVTPSNGLCVCVDARRGLESVSCPVFPPVSPFVKNILSSSAAAGVERERNNNFYFSFQVHCCIRDMRYEFQQPLW